MIFMENSALSYDDIYLKPCRSDLNSRSDAKINVDIMKNPIILSPMVGTTSKQMIRYFVDNDMLPTVHRYFQSASDQYQHVLESVQLETDKVFFAVGANTEWIDWLINHGVTKFLPDFAHGWSKSCINTIEYIKNKGRGYFDIMAGNVDSYGGYVALINAGATMVRVGISSGQICSTGPNTGFGTPMITSLMECYRAKQDVGGLIICDGGISNGGRIAKALCFADYVMIGSLIGSTDLAEGPFYDRDGKLTTDDPYYVEFFGMASSKARQYNGTHTTNVSIEGVSGLNRYIGTTSDVITQLENNMRASMSYVGARNWVEYQQNVEIGQLTNSGFNEKITHMDKYD